MSQSEASRLLRQEEIFGADETIDASGLELREEVISLNRVAKVVKGGRRFSFSALVVVGDGKQYVGLGFGKANEVPESIGKAVENARKSLIRMPRLGATIPHEVIGQFGSARVLLKPASPGTGIIASQAIRNIMDLGGISDILAKNLGSDNVMNVLKATMNGLRSILHAEKIAWLRGKPIEEMVGRRRAKLYAEAHHYTGPVPSDDSGFGGHGESQAASFGGQPDEMLPSSHRGGRGGRSFDE